MRAKPPARFRRRSAPRPLPAECLEPRLFLSATVVGNVYHDLDASGQRGGSDPYLGGVTVYADLDGDGVLDAGEPAVVSNPENGYYQLTLDPGAYTLRATGPGPGYVVSQPAGGAYNVTLPPDGTTQGLPFGVYTTGTILVTLFNDLDGNGTRSDNEPPLAGRTVYREGEISNDVFDPGELSAVTSDDGVARFDGLRPGRLHTFRTVLPPGWAETSMYNDNPISGGVDSAGTTTLAMGAWQTPNSVPLTGTIYDDADASRRRDGGEAGLEGWTVFLDADHDGLLDPGETTTTTDAGGAYVLDAPAPAHNYVRAIFPEGWTRTLPTGAASNGVYFVLTAVGQPKGGLDFGAMHVPPASVSGEIYNDLNANGVRDAGEPPLATGNVYVDIGGNGSVADDASAAVDATGHFTVPGLPPGTYLVKFGSGYVQTDPMLDDRGFNPGRTVTVVAGQDYTGVVFGAVSRAATATLMGEIRLDSNADGVPDGGIMNNVVAYVDANNNGRLDAGEPSNRQFANVFALQGLAPGTYTVRAVVPEGYRQTFPYPPGTGHTVTVAAGQQVSTLNFSLAPANHPSVVAGTMYADINGNGRRDAGEPIRSGLAWIDLDNDAVRDAGEPGMATDASGRWSLSVPGPGTYTVRAQKLDTETFTQPVGGAYTVTVGPNDLAPGRDFGFITTTNLPEVGGLVFNDANGNGVRDAGETAPAGRVVWLDANDNLVPDLGEPTATQGVDGFTFRDVLPGTYNVRVVIPAGMRQTAPASRAARVITVTVGHSSFGATFGLAPALPDSTPPIVSGQFVRSSTWSQPFLSALAAAKLGTDGYDFIQPSTGAPRTLPWANVDTFVLRFSEDVRVQAEDLRVTGVRGGTFAVRSFHYDPVTATATWRFDRPFAADRILLELDADAPDGVTDLAGNPLQGKLTAPGDYVTGFTVLTGDATGDRKVDAADVLAVRRRQGTTPASRGVGVYAYSPFADFDGNARINATDAALVRLNYARTLPPAPAPAPTASAPPVQRVSTTRDLFSAAPLLTPPG